MPRIAYMSTVGSSDPTRASLPLHLAANGSVEVGHEVVVLLAGDATELVKAEISGRIQGVGVPAMTELLGKLREHRVPVFV
jgi:predicted peroxiredoxin